MNEDKKNKLNREIEADANKFNITVIILKSGTAELERYQMTYGFCIDVMILLLLAEVLHRLNILSIEED